MEACSPYLKSTQPLNQSCFLTIRTGLKHNSIIFQGYERESMVLEGIEISIHPKGSYLPVV